MTKPILPIFFNIKTSRYKETLMSKLSVNLAPPTDALLARVGEDNVSGAVNEAVARYLAIMDDARPDFSRPEWYAICDILNGTFIDECFTIQPGLHVAMEMEDAQKFNKIYEKWDIDGPTLVAKLAGLRIADGLAVLHVVETFWAHSDLGRVEALALALTGVKSK